MCICSITCISMQTVIFVKLLPLARYDHDLSELLYANNYLANNKNLPTYNIHKCHTEISETHFDAFIEN